MVRNIADTGENSQQLRSGFGYCDAVQLVRVWRIAAIFLTAMLGLVMASPAAAQISFTMNTGNSATNAQKLLIDSNNCGVDGPNAAYVGGTITNTSGSDITNVQATMSGLNADIFFAGGQSASQTIGTLAAGQTIGIYWFTGYSCNEFATATPTVSITSSAGTTSATLNLEIFDAISANAGGTVQSTLLGPGAVVGQTITMDVEYSFGGANVGDEYFLQPAGNLTFNAGCFRLVGAEITGGIVTAIPNGTTDQLYFQATAKQTGSNKTANVRYYFQYLCQDQSTTADPYATQTSGNTNIKYTGNFGTTAITYPPGTNPFTISKTVTPDVATSGDATSTLTYTVTIANPSANATIIDSIVDQLPAGMTFLGFASGSDVTAANSSSVPAAGATGILTFTGRLGTSYALAGNSSISLIYTVSVPSTPGDYVNTAQAQYGLSSSPTATASFTLLPAPVAVTESGTGVAGVASTPIANVRSNDTVGGVQADATNSAVAISGSWPTGITLDTTTGAISIDETVAAGTYSIDYELCDLNSPANCVTVTDSITVVAPEADLSITKTNGTTAVLPGATTTYTLTISHDGGDPITGAIVTDTPGAGLTCDATNPVTITGDGVPAGSFTIADLTGSGIVLGTLSSTQTTTLSYSCQVN